MIFALTQGVATRVNEETQTLSSSARAMQVVSAAGATVAAGLSLKLREGYSSAKGPLSRRSGRVWPASLRAAQRAVWHESKVTRKILGDTGVAGLREAGAPAEVSEAKLLKEYRIEGGQLDARGPMGATRKKKKYPETAESAQFWPAPMLDMDPRLGAARGIDKTDTLARIKV